MHTERVTRHAENFERWLAWLIDVHQMVTRYKEDIYNSPMYTHSCNRYFQPCQLIPFCSSTKDEQELLLEDEFRTDAWDPLAKETE